MIGLWAACAAWGASIGEEDFERLRDTVAPQVEAAVGRRLLARPPIRIARADEVIAALAKGSRDQLVAAGAPPEQADASARALARGVVTNALAVYSGGDRVVYAVEDNLERWLQSYRVDDQQLLEDVAACVMAHELTHALQDQYAEPAAGDTPDAALRWRALAEGQADTVQSLVCDTARPDAALLLADGAPARGLSQQSLAADSPEFLYDYGSAWVRDLWSREGAEAVWRALAAPPTYDAIVARVDTLRSDPWWKADWVKKLGTELRGRPVAGTVERASLSGALSALWPDLPVSDLPRSRAGVYYTAIDGDTELRLGVWSVGDAVTASRFVARRIKDLQGFKQGQRTRFMTARGLVVTDTPVLRALPSTEVSLLFRIGAGEYEEAWLLDGDRLAVVAVTDVALRAGHAAERLKETLASLPPVPGSPEVSPAGEPAEHAAVWNWWLVGAARAREAGDLATCLRHAEQIDPAQSPRARDALAMAGVGCAVEANDLARAEATVARLGGLDPVPEATRVNYALGYERAGRHTDALRVLDGWVPTDAKIRALAADTRIVASVNLQRWKDVVILAQAPDVPMSRRFEAAEVMTRLGRKSDAVTVLKVACAAASEAERPTCQKRLAALGG